LGHLIAYFSEKLKGSHLNYSTYDKELYALDRTLQNWQHYLFPKEFVIHKQGKSNVVAYALSRGHTLLNVLDTQYLGCDHIKEIYKDNLDFSLIFQEWSKDGHKEFIIHDGFLFKGKRLCVPQGSLRQSLVREAREGGLMGHFGVAKTLDTLHEHSFGPTCANSYIAYVLSA